MGRRRKRKHRRQMPSERAERAARELLASEAESASAVPSEASVPTEPVPGSDGRGARIPRVIVCALFLVLLAVYNLDGTFSVGHDATANAYLPVAMFSSGRLTFTPDDAPFMFEWTVEEADAVRRLELRRWDEHARSLRQRSRPTPKARYFLTQTPAPGSYVGIFGPGPGLLAAPVYAVVGPFVDSLWNSPRAVWWCAKFAASLMVAASAVFVLLTAARFARSARLVSLGARPEHGLAAWRGTPAPSDLSPAMSREPCVARCAAGAAQQGQAPRPQGG
jgi:hypothetical protein